MSKDQRTITREQFIARYVASARAAGFGIEATADGCIYKDDPEWDQEELRMFARPCDCGCVEGWGMFR